MLFSGIVICSDYDGTLSWGDIPESNIKAIKYFQDNGGLFTFCSGRMAELFADMNLGFESNAPIAGFSGAQLWDPLKKTMIKAKFLEDYEDYVHGLIDACPRIVRMNILCKEHGGHVPATHEDVAKVFSECNGVYKISCEHSIVSDKMIPDEIIAYNNGKFNIVSNGGGCFELLPPDASKGNAAADIKEYTKSDVLVCVGDYQGDMSMLEVADIGYAAGNAREEVKKIADKVTCHAREGVIAWIVEDLRKMREKNHEKL